MHLGNVFSALLSWLSAKSKGGRWLLRIEDIDPQRSKKEYAQLLMDDLEWLGLSWDGTPVYQSERSDLYEHYFQQLKEKGLRNLLQVNVLMDMAAGCEPRRTCSSNHAGWEIPQPGEGISSRDTEETEALGDRDH